MTSADGQQQFHEREGQYRQERSSGSNTQHCKAGAAAVEGGATPFDLLISYLNASCLILFFALSLLPSLFVYAVSGYGYFPKLKLYRTEYFLLDFITVVGGTFGVKQGSPSRTNTMYAYCIISCP